MPIDWKKMEEENPLFIGKGAPKASRAEREKERRDRQEGAAAEWIRSLRCIFTNEPNPIAGHARKTRGAGGAYRDLVPFSPRVEAAWHREGRETLPRKYGRSHAWVCGVADMLWSISPANEEAVPLFHGALANAGDTYLQLTSLNSSGFWYDVLPVRCRSDDFPCLQRFSVRLQRADDQLIFPIHDEAANHPYVHPVYEIWHSRACVAYASTDADACVGVEVLSGLRELEDGMVWRSGLKPRREK